MALATLELVELSDAAARFRLDTGTNRYFTIRIGRTATERAGYRWVDDVILETPLRPSPRGGEMLATATEVTVPVPMEQRSPSATLKKKHTCVIFTN